MARKSLRSWAPGLALAALCVACGASCSASTPKPSASSHPLTASELSLRRSLGVPDEAKQVVVFAQTSHLDIDWQQTFDAYYANFVETAFVQARQLLESQPRAFYSVAEMAFLQQHVAAHPEELAALQAAARRGALRIVGGGMTSPDTLLPEPEMLFRDFLYGIRFSEDTFGVTPTAAWLPDSFGHSGSAPDILAAAGFQSVAFSRIDGSATIFEQIFKSSIAALPGSTAALLEHLGSSDFLWHGTGGGTVFAHFISGKGLYCEGEDIDYASVLEVAGGHLVPYSGDDPSFTDGRIDGYVAENTPYAKTPYLFVPVGCDFEPPKPQLISYLDGYDKRRYPTTGAWAVAAPFDDYAALLSNWHDVLPDVTGDLAPAYMGFYGTRPALKRAVRDAGRPFFVAEAFATVLGDAGAAMTSGAAPTLSLLTRSDHHDFVTGTSSDAVVDNEQLPLLAAAMQTGEADEQQVAEALGARVPVTSGAVTRALAFNASSAARSETAEVTLPLGSGLTLPVQASIGGQSIPLEVVTPPAQTTGSALVRLALPSVPPWSWSTIDFFPGAGPTPSEEVTLDLLDASGSPATGSAIARVVLSNADVRAQLDAGSAGFTLTSLTIDGANVLSGPSLTFNEYADEGGLWRLGNEMGPGCTLAPMSPPPGPTIVTVLESSPIEAVVAFAGPGVSIQASLGAGMTGLDVSVSTAAAVATTRTVSIAFSASAGDAMSTSSPGGVEVRPSQHVFDPTFFAAEGWADVAGSAVLLRHSTGVRMSTPGAVELMVARNAQSEQCDVMGGTGSDPGVHTSEWRLVRAKTAADAEVAAQSFDRPTEVLMVGTAQSSGGASLPAQASLASLKGGGIISAIKPAERGAGVIVRALLLAGPGDLTLGATLAGRAMSYVDLAEHQGQVLGPAPGVVRLDPQDLGSVVGVRLE